MERVCKCSSHLGMWASKKGDEKIYENLYQCIDCGKNYLLKDGKFKYISKSEFRRIIGSRKNYMIGLGDL